MHGDELAEHTVIGAFIQMRGDKRMCKQPLLYETLMGMPIDETGTARLESDHRQLTLNFGSSTVRQSPPKGLTNKEVEIVTKELERGAENAPIQQNTDVNCMLREIIKMKKKKGVSARTLIDGEKGGGMAKWQRQQTRGDGHARST